MKGALCRIEFLNLFVSHTELTVPVKVGHIRETKPVGRHDPYHSTVSNIRDGCSTQLTFTASHGSTNFSYNLRCSWGWLANSGCYRSLTVQEEVQVSTKCSRMAFTGKYSGYALSCRNVDIQDGTEIRRNVSMTRLSSDRVAHCSRC